MGGRGISLLMAWQVWMISSQIFREYSPIQEGYTHVPEEPWGILGLVIPIFLAWIFYRLVARLAPKAQQVGAGNSLPAQ